MLLLSGVLRRIKTKQRWGYEMSMKQFSLRKSLFVLLAGFAVLFLFRLGYGYATHPAGGTENEQVAGRSSTSFSYTGKNYASKGAKPGSGSRPSPGSQTPLSVDQKYEKVGTVSTKSKDYESDEAKIRGVIERVGGLIQFEQSSGLESQRSLHLAIGVVPEKFDLLISELRGFGTLMSIRIDKNDKTNEYKMLQAKRTSLDSTKKSLLALKNMGTGSIEELIRLEDKISQTESQIQDLGVNLGDYDSENEFCTVKCSLLEIATHTSPSIGWLHRIKVAGEWSVKIYFKLISTAVIGVIGIWVATLAVFQIGKWLPKFSVS